MFAANQQFKRLARYGGFVLSTLLGVVLGAQSASAQLVITGVSVANVTPSGFTLVWANTPGSTPLVSLFTDVGGTSNLVGTVGISYFPLHTGDPLTGNSFDRRVSQDSIRQQMISQGFSVVRVSGLQPGATYFYQLQVSNTNGQSTVFPTSGALPSVTTASQNIFVTQSEELAITLVGATTPGYIVMLSNSNCATPLAEVSGDGTTSNKVFFSINDLVAASGNSNLQLGGDQQFTVTVIGYPTPLALQTFSLTLPSSFVVNHDDDISVTLSNVTSLPPVVSCPGSISTNLMPCQSAVPITFAASATGVPAPSITYMLGDNIISSPYPFPAGTNIVTCVASNAAGVDQCSFTVTVAPAPVPVAGTNSTLGTSQNTAVSFSASKLAASGTGPAGHALSIAAVNPLSANNGSVVLNGNVITYIPTNGFFGQDVITYTLSDGCETALGTILVTVKASSSGTHNVISITVIGSNRTVKFAGIPGQNYYIQSAALATGPWSNLAGPIAADANGFITYNDTTMPMPPQRFYRTTTQAP